MNETAATTQAPQPPHAGLLLYCRPGFEMDAGLEVEAVAGSLGMPGTARLEPGQGWLLFYPKLSHGEADDSLLPAWRDLVFARQRLRVIADLPDLPRSNRLTPVLTALAAERGRYSEVWGEHPDSDEGRPLATLARKFAHAAVAPLRKAGLLDPDQGKLPRLHLFFATGSRLILASSRPGQASPYPLGVPRLKQDPAAPSRSALKLEEAFQVLLQEGERRRLLRPGLSAVDLGAAPGGWSFVLSRHSMRVTAIDNGPLAPVVLDSGLVEHLRADAFSWKPPKPVDWLVCDVVEQPHRVAERIATWLKGGWCKQALFNLKLPMNKRLEAWQQCRDLLATGAPGWQLRARHLYHDREEITVLALPKAR